ncbi:methylated-DNA--[protein]-cysteine S-methyltransferase [Alteribacter natronophilus]|uniref:methylated-DNA--[protein]-cysteine S-methyltransferase n=1 Tax=Alteribacter natronophilus TaxID=2583810 RepID=UPI00110D79AC|nr:methylated-DNA--[protein]-cysteine S-methyltransferase [Alteribacter natronophilus]TMW69895.1 methylated-DNA--[protein]-cysteine S-methyltransferase [Alteribacter natronophilus]
MTKRSFIYVTEMNSPIGALTIASTDYGVCLIEFGPVKESCSAIRTWTKKHFMNAELKEDAEKLQPVVTELEEYFAGTRTSFSVKLDLVGSKFQCLVWEKVKLIPYGETKSYKQIAMEIGAPKAVRAIGGSNNKNPVPILIPCHRVIGSNGSMVGYGGGLDKKEHLLRLEGAIERIS